LRRATGERNTNSRFARDALPHLSKAGASSSSSSSHGTGSMGDFKISSAAPLAGENGDSSRFDRGEGDTYRPNRERDRDRDRERDRDRREKDREPRGWDSYRPGQERRGGDSYRPLREGEREEERDKEGDPYRSGLGSAGLNRRFERDGKGGDRDNNGHRRERERDAGGDSWRRGNATEDNRPGEMGVYQCCREGPDAYHSCLTPSSVNWRARSPSSPPGTRT
jgi:hypothetical protein